MRRYISGTSAPNRNWNGPRNCPHSAHRFAASKRFTLRSGFCLAYPALLPSLIDGYDWWVSRPGRNCSSGIVRTTTPSLRISLRFQMLLIYFQNQQWQQQPQQLSLLLPNLIQLNFVIYFIRLYWPQHPRPCLSAFLRSSIHWISVTRRATRNAFLTFRTFPIHLHNTVQSAEREKKLFNTYQKHKKRIGCTLGREWAEGV